MKKLFCLAISLLLALSVASSALAVNLTMGHVDPATAQIGIATLHFAELVSQKTNGEVTIDVFPNSELGSSADILQQVMVGSTDLCDPGAEELASVCPQAALLSLPYIIKNGDMLFKVAELVNTELLNAALESEGMYCLGYLANGWRHTISKTDIKDFDALKGLTIRVQEADLQLELWKAFGTRPVAIAYSELYTALQTGVCDAFENQPVGVVANKFYEVTDYMLLTGHLYQVKPILINLDTWNGLTESQQAALQEAAKEAIDQGKDLLEEEYLGQLEMLREQGMVIYECDTTPFEAAVAPIVERVARELGAEELLEEIKALQ